MFGEKLNVGGREDLFFGGTKHCLVSVLVVPPSLAKSWVRHWHRHIKIKQCSRLVSGGKSFLGLLKGRISSQNVPAVT